MRLPRVPVVEAALLIAVVLVTAGLVYLWTQAQGSAADLSDAERQMALLDEDAVNEQISELEDRLQQAREAPTLDPFPTRREVVQSIAALRGVLVASPVQLSSFSVQETTATLGETAPQGEQQTYPGLALDLVAVGTPEAHLALLGSIVEQLPDLVLQDVALVRQENVEGFKVTISAVLYHQADEQQPSTGER